MNTLKNKANIAFGVLASVLALGALPGEAKAGSLVVGKEVRIGNGFTSEQALIDSYSDPVGGGSGGIGGDSGGIGGGDIGSSTQEPECPFAIKEYGVFHHTGLDPLYEVRVEVAHNGKTLLTKSSIAFHNDSSENPLGGSCSSYTAFPSDMLQEVLARLEGSFRMLPENTKKESLPAYSGRCPASVTVVQNDLDCL